MRLLLLALLASTTAAAAPQGQQADLAAIQWLGDDNREVSGTPWWEQMGDANLTRIVKAAVEQNSGLKAAWAQSAQAKAAATQSVSPLLPQASFTAAANMGPRDAIGFGFGFGGGGQPVDTNLYWTGNYGLQASWEIDLFGRNTATWRGSHHDARAAAGDRDAQILALALRAGEAYYDIVSAEQRLELTRSQLEATQTLTELVQLRYEGGDASAVDLLQQRQQLAAAQSRVAQAELLLTTLKNQLAVALALPPGTDLGPMATTFAPLPESPGIGDPDDLVDNRPDIRSAQSRIRAAASRKTAAAMSLAPTVRLQANVGEQGNNIADPDNWQWIETWGAGATLTVPLFNGGRTWSGIQAANSGVMAAVQSYNNTVATAVIEVENARAQEAQAVQQLEAMKAQEQAAQLAFEEAQIQYRGGTGNYLVLLSTQNTWLGASLTRIDAERSLMSARMQLHDALGGAWTRQFVRPGGSR